MKQSNWVIQSGTQKAKKLKREMSNSCKPKEPQKYLCWIVEVGFELDEGELKWREKNQNLSRMWRCHENSIIKVEVDTALSRLPKELAWMDPQSNWKESRWKYNSVRFNLKQLVSNDLRVISFISWVAYLWFGSVLQKAPWKFCNWAVFSFYSFLVFSFYYYYIIIRSLCLAIFKVYLLC